MVLERDEAGIFSLNEDCRTFEGERYDGSRNNGSVACRLIVTLQRILDDTESEWDRDHGSPGIKDRFGALRDYMENLRDWCT